MHIPEGMLPPAWAGTWYAFCIPFFYGGLRQAKERLKVLSFFKILMGLLAAAIFIISLIPIPVGTPGTCAHPAGTPAAAILVGPLPAVVLSAASLLLHVFFFGHGGLTTLGANTFSMGVIGPLAGYGLFQLGRKLRLSVGLAAGLAGALGSAAIYFTSAFQLAVIAQGELSLVGAYLTILAAYLPTQLPLSLVEGLITGLMVGYIYKVRPEIFYRLRIIPFPDNEKHQPRG